MPPTRKLITLGAVVAVAVSGITLAQTPATIRWGRIINQ